VTIRSVTLTFCDTYVMCNKRLMTTRFVTISLCGLTLCSCIVGRKMGSEVMEMMAAGDGDALAGRDARIGRDNNAREIGGGYV
jgi:hypothetical protein